MTPASRAERARWLRPLALPLWTMGGSAESLVGHDCFRMILDVLVPKIIEGWFTNAQRAGA
jgi:hypothetical protein